MLCCTSCSLCCLSPAWIQYVNGFLRGEKLTAESLWNQVRMMSFGVVCAASCINIMTSLRRRSTPALNCSILYCMCCMLRSMTSSFISLPSGYFSVTIIPHLFTFRGQSELVIRDVSVSQPWNIATPQTEILSSAHSDIPFSTEHSDPSQNLPTEPPWACLWHFGSQVSAEGITLLLWLP